MHLYNNNKIFFGNPLTLRYFAHNEKLILIIFERFISFEYK